MKKFKVGMILLITILTMTTVSLAQTFSGSIGSVVDYPATIELDKWTRKFTGSYEFVPGVMVPIKGNVRNGRFAVDGWFSVPAKITANSILGDGVQLWKMSGGVRQARSVSSLRPRLGTSWARHSRGGARSGSLSTSIPVRSATGFTRGMISSRSLDVVG